MKFLSQINVNTRYTLPIVDGTNGQVLSTDGNGVAYWGTISAGSLTLDGLSDVIITSPASGQLLRYGIPPGSGEVTPVWYNFTPNYLTPSSSIDALNDVTITSAATGQVLQWSGSAWVNATVTSAGYVSKVQHEVKAGVAITKGQAVYITGSDGTNMVVGLADNTSDGTSSKTMGLALANASVNNKFFVVTEGLIDGLNTSTATTGDPVWLGTNGNILFGLANKPVAAAHLVYLGVVTRVNQNNGEIFVHVQNGFELNELHDVLINGVSTGQLLRRESDGLWKNWTPNFLTSLPAHNHNDIYYTETEINSFFGGEVEMPGYNLLDWDAAYADKINSASFSTTTGVLTLTQQDAGTVTVDLDGRFYLDTNPSGYITSSGNTSGYSGSLLADDNRTISPSEASASRLRFGFTSWANNNSAPYADYLHLRSYTDSSGGSDNLVMFKKTGIGMRLWQQTFGSATAYSSFVDVWTTGDFTSTDVSNWNTAYGWGDHAEAGYLTNYSYTETDTLSTVTGRGGSTGSLVVMYGKVTLGNNSTGTYSGNTTGLTLNSTAEVRSTSIQNPPALTWHYEGLATRHLLMTSGGVFNFVSPSNEASGVAVVQVNGNTVWHAGNLTNLNQLTNGPGYITGYTETDTLASVTGRGATTTTPITVTASEGREVAVYMPSSYTTDDLVSGHEYGWYSDHWRLGMTRSGGAAGADFVVQWNGGRKLSLTNGGNLTTTGSISATNFSGSSSGTNTGDQTNISGNAATATNAVAASNLSITSLGTGSVNVNNGQSAVYRNENGAGGNLSYAPVLHLAATDTMWQIQGDYYDSSTLRWRAGYNGTWYAWRDIIHSGNIGSQSVASAGNATTAGGLSVHAGRNNEVNKIVRTDVNAHLLTGWINTTSGAFSSAINKIYCSDDDYVRYQTPANFISNLGLITTSNVGSQSVTSLNSGNFISQRGSNGSWNADFSSTPAGTASYGGDLGANGVNGPGGSWWIQQNFRHTNGGSLWGVQVAWGWEDNPNRLASRSISGGTFGGWVYYLNSSNFTTWAQEKENQRLSTSSSVTFSDIYADNWFRNNNVNEGLYNQATGTHFYSHSGQGWVVTGSGGTIELQFRSNHQSTLRGYVYADTNNNIGFLNNGGGWSIRTDSSSNAFVHGTTLTISADGQASSNIIMNDGDEGNRTIHCNSNRIGFLNQAGSWGSYCNDNGSWESDVAMYAPIFYDTANTAYYGDFASTSRFNATITDTSYFGALSSNGRAQGYGANSSSLHKIAYISFDWNSNYDSYQYHGIASTDYTGGFSDNISINSYNDITFRLDSNGNNAASYVRFMNDSTGNNTFSSLGYDGSTYFAAFSRDLYIDGNRGGNFGNRLVIGGTTTPYTMQDANARPTAYLRGAYPVLTLDHTETNNADHGPSIQFTFNGSNARQWVIGCGGSGNFMDFGFSSAGYGNTNYNPHNGIAGYNGNTIMRIIDSRVGIGGDWGTYGSVANPEYTLDVRGTIYSNTDMRAPIFYDANDTNYYVDPNGTSVLNALTLNGRLNAYSGIVYLNEIRFTNTAGSTQSDPYTMRWISEDSARGAGLSWLEFQLNDDSNEEIRIYGNSCAGFTCGTYSDNLYHRFNASGYAWHQSTVEAPTVYGSTTVYSPTILVNGHSDNTKGYRIHNTSGSSVSAMFTNSSNELVIAAGAVNQINLNKKVYVNGVALGVNVAPSATAGRIDASNDIVAFSSSDERLKDNITPIENALDKVKSLTGVEFDWKPEHKGAHGHEGHDTGIIAQQVLGVMPSAVRTNDTGYLAVRYEKLIGLLIEGMKEQQTQIDELKAKLDGLTK
jgi:hypothetical protein